MPGEKPGAIAAWLSKFPLMVPAPARVEICELALPDTPMKTVLAAIEEPAWRIKPPSCCVHMCANQRCVYRAPTNHKEQHVDGKTDRPSRQNHQQRSLMLMIRSITRGNRYGAVDGSGTKSNHSVGERENTSSGLQQTLTGESDNSIDRSSRVEGCLDYAHINTRAAPPSTSTYIAQTHHTNEKRHYTYTTYR